MVSAKHVSGGIRGIQAPHRYLWGTGQVWLQRVHTDVQSRTLRSGCLGRVIQKGRRKICGPCGGASRWLCHVRQWLERLDGSQARSEERRVGEEREMRM